MLEFSGRRASSAFISDLEQASREAMSHLASRVRDGEFVLAPGRTVNLGNEANRKAVGVAFTIKWMRLLGSRDAWRSKLSELDREVDEAKDENLLLAAAHLTLKGIWGSEMVCRAAAEHLDDRRVREAAVHQLFANLQAFDIVMMQPLDGEAALSEATPSMELLPELQFASRFANDRYLEHIISRT